MGPTYDRPLTTDTIFAIQDEIAAAIVAALREKIGATSAKRRAPLRPRTMSMPTSFTSRAGHCFSRGGISTRQTASSSKQSDTTRDLRMR